MSRLEGMEKHICCARISLQNLKSVTAIAKELRDLSSGNEYGDFEALQDDLFTIRRALSYELVFRTCIVWYDPRSKLWERAANILDVSIENENNRLDKRKASSRTRKKLKKLLNALEDKGILEKSDKKQTLRLFKPIYGLRNNLAHPDVSPISSFEIKEIEFLLEIGEYTMRKIQEAENRPPLETFNLHKRELDGLYFLLKKGMIRFHSEMELQERGIFPCSVCFETKRIDASFYQEQWENWVCLDCSIQRSGSPG